MAVRFVLLRPVGLIRTSNIDVRPVRLFFKPDGADSSRKASGEQEMNDLAKDLAVPAYEPQRDVLGRILPGQPAMNPKGRRPHSHRARTLARKYTRQAVETLAREMDTATRSADRIAAASELLNRGWGRPAQQMRAEVESKSVVVHLPWLTGRNIVRDLP